MKRVVGIFILLTSAALAAEDKQDDPLFGGVPLTTLLENAVRRVVPHEPTWGMHNGGFIPDPRAEDAVRQTGTNALPYLVKMIREEPPSRAYPVLNAFRLLGATGSPAIPALESLAETSTNYETSSRAIWAMRYIGSNSVPALARLSTNANTREVAVRALVDIGADGVAIQPIQLILDKLIQEGDGAAKTVVIGLSGLPATNAIPMLTNVLHHAEVPVRELAIEVIYLFQARAPQTIPALTECLYDSDAGVRQAAADALRRIAPDMFVTNSVPQTPK